MRHTCVLYNSTGLEGQSLQIFNEVDITETSNFELVMRLETDIQSEDLFYTDLNGLNVSTGFCTTLIVVFRIYGVD